MEHPSRYFSYQRTDVDARENIRNYYGCRLLRDLPYDTVAVGHQFVTMHDDTLAKQGAALELIQETPDKHLYGWQGNEIVLDFVY
jgi:hypothetical protein